MTAASRIGAIAWSVLAITLALVGCSDPDRLSTSNPVWTLYGEASTPAGQRLHVATFDADQMGVENSVNCETTRRLYAAQEGAGRYWCELGRFREAPAKPLRH